MFEHVLGTGSAAGLASGRAAGTDTLRAERGARSGALSES